MISFIVPARNEEKYIEASLRSIFNQAIDEPYEVIVVDNSSTDRTVEVVQNQFPKAQVFHESTLGINATRHKGFIESKGDILIYVDADTHLPPDWTKQAISILRSSEKIVAVSGPYRYYDLYSKFYQRLLYLAEVYVFLSAWLSDRLFHWNTILRAGDMAIKRKTLLAIGGFDPQFKFYREDVDAAKKLLKHGRVLFVWSLWVDTSARRFKKAGVIRQMWNYFFQHWMGILSGKPRKEEVDEPR